MISLLQFTRIFKYNFFSSDDNLGIVRSHGEKIESSIEQTTTKTENRFDNFIGSIMGLMKNNKNHKYKSIFQTYLVTETDPNYQTKFALRTAAHEMLEFLEKTNNELDVASTNEFRLKLLNFYKYYQLLHLEELNKLLQEKKDIIKNLNENPEIFLTEKILIDIMTKNNQ